VYFLSYSCFNLSKTTCFLGLVVQTSPNFFKDGIFMFLFLLVAWGNFPEEDGERLDFSPYHAQIFFYYFVSSKTKMVLKLF
jgi:hypothetical protein